MRILCFGDSNTYGYDPRLYSGGRYPAECRWVDILAAKTGWDVHNEGENGRTIPKYEHELYGFRQLLKSYPPLDLLIVMLGTNDLLLGANASEAAVRMEAFLEQLSIARERILLLAPPPLRRGVWVDDESTVRESHLLIQRYEQLAARMGVRFNAFDRAALTFDGIHLCEDDHKSLAQQLYALLTPCAG